jgi:hypothetical protein
MKRLGDFVQVANVASLPENGANESALYYCVAENILCKWNGASWSQINKDTGMTSVEVVGEGNAVTAAEYNAETRKLTMTKGATYATPAVVDSKIATAVGELGNDTEGNAYANVKAYVDAKTEGIATDAALGELQGRVDAAEDAIEDLQTWVGGSSVGSQIDAKITALDLANTYEAKGAAAEVQGDLDEYKEANDEAVKAAADAAAGAQADVDALSDKVGVVSENKTVVQMIADAQTAATYNDTEVRGLISDNAGAIEALEGTHATDKQALEGAIALKADKSVVDAIAEDYLKGADKTELQGKIDLKADKTAVEAIDDRLEEVEAFFKLAEGESLNDALDTLVEIQNYITSEGAAADQMVLDIAANKAAHEKNAEDIAKEIKDREDADKALSDRIDGIHGHDNKEVLDGITAAKVAAWDAAEQNAKDYADDLDEAMGARVKALEDIDHEAYKAYADQVAAAAAQDAANKDAVVLAEAQKGINTNAEAIATKASQADLDAAVERVAANEGKISALETASATHALKTEVEAVQADLDGYKESNNAAVAGKADKATTLAGYGIADAYTKAEVEAMLTWGSF